jgi:hypothetical protein
MLPTRSINEEHSKQYLIQLFFYSDMVNLVIQTLNIVLLQDISTTEDDVTPSSSLESPVAHCAGIEGRP